MGMSKRLPMKAALALIAAAMLAGCGSKTPEGTQAPTSAQQGTTLGESTGGAESGSGIVLPRIELPKGDGSEAADMIGLLVYQGRVYTQTATKIAVRDAAPLVGDKLGRTIGMIDEWSKQDAYANEFASSIGQVDIYSVKGYDPAFRVMSYEKFDDGVVAAEFYECLNGIRISSGKDVFGLLRLEGRVQGAEWEDYGSWNYSKGEMRALPADAPALDAFVKALDEAKPLRQEDLKNDDIYNDPDQRFVHLRLSDQSVVMLRLFGDGYVSYWPAHVFFQMEQPAFEQLWQLLEGESDETPAGSVG